MAFSLKQEFLRKLIHLSSFWIVGLIWILPRVWSILALSIITAFVFITEYETHKSPLCARIYRVLFSPVLREKEKGGSFGFSGAPYVLVAALALVIIFPKEVAMFSISILLISDSAAALIGRAFGRFKLIGKKTVEGTSAFLIAGFLVCLLFNWGFGLPILPSFIGVCLGCLGDLFNEKVCIDDNLSIPLLAALPFLF